MEVAAGVGAGLLGLYYISRRRGCLVNCWFCNTDQRVPWSDRNAFVCTQCEQYNGFTADGDYNRRIPGQFAPLQRTPPQKFCAPPRRTNGPPDLLPSTPGNVLCDECNKKQEIIVQKINRFEPINEDRWQAELDDYKHKLNKVYSLCERCVMATQKKLSKDKEIYGYLMHLQKFGGSVFSAVGRISKHAVGQITNAKRRGRHWFAGGTVTESMHTACACAAMLLALAEFHFLQQDASEIPSLDGFVPPIVSAGLLSLHRYCFHLSTLIFSMHVVSILTNKCRISFPDLLVLPLCTLLWLCSIEVPIQYKQDVALCQCGFSSILSVLTGAVWLLPRKLKHKKRPNTISSAFSVASTPVSQCSSQRSSRNASPNTQTMLDASLIRLEHDYHKELFRSEPANLFGHPEPPQFAVTQPTTSTSSQVSSWSSRLRNGKLEGNKENQAPSVVSSVHLAHRAPSVLSHLSATSTASSSSTLIAPSSSGTSLSMRWRENREQTPGPTSPGAAEMSADMEWESSVANSPLTNAGASVLRQRQLARLQHSRENTPSREIGGMLGGLNLGVDAAGKHTPRRGPFGSLSFNPAVRHAYSHIGGFSGGRPGTPGSFQANSHLSGFTSVSQRAPNPFAAPTLRSARISPDDSASIVTRCTDSPARSQFFLYVLAILSIFLNITVLAYLMWK